MNCGGFNNVFKEEKLRKFTAWLGGGGRRNSFLVVMGPSWTSFCLPLRMSVLQLSTQSDPNMKG